MDMLRHIRERGVNQIGATREGGADMAGFTKLWVDDEQPLPRDCLDEGCWQRSTTPYEAMTKLELLQFEEVDIGHVDCHIGNKDITGYDILLWLIEKKEHGDYVPPKIKILASNTDGWNRMKELIKRYNNDHNIQKQRR